MNKPHSLSSLPYPSRLVQAQFVVSAAKLEQLPASLAPEVCFVGRSNAGKSTAINVLAGQRRLAFASRTPGRTRLINMFGILKPESQLARKQKQYRKTPKNLVAPISPDDWAGFLVDLPGYGYASVAESDRLQWDRVLGGYLSERSALVAVVMMVDSRRGLTDLDTQCLVWMQRSPRRLLILLTKADKLTQNERQLSLRALQKTLSELQVSADVLLFSSTKRLGIEAAQQWIENCLGLNVVELAELGSLAETLPISAETPAETPAEVPTEAPPSANNAVLE